MSKQFNWDDVISRPVSTRLTGSAENMKLWKDTIVHYIKNPITPDEIQLWIDLDLRPKALCDIKDMSNDEWLEMRRVGPKGDMPFLFGGSTVSSITNGQGTLGSSSPWNSLMDTWTAKTNRPVKNEQEFNAASKAAGHIFEDAVANSIVLHEGYEGVEIEDDTNFYQHPVLPFIGINMDKIFYDVIDGKRTKILGEVKTTGSRNFEAHRNWRDGIVPVYYDLQVRTYQAVSMNLDLAYIICSWGFPKEAAIVQIKRDLDIEATMLNSLVQMAALIMFDVEPSFGMGFESDSKLILTSIRRIYGVPEIREVEVTDKKFERYFAAFDKQSERAKTMDTVHKEKMVSVEASKLEALTNILAVDPEANQFIFETKDKIYKLERKVSKRTSFDKKALVADAMDDPSLLKYFSMGTPALRKAINTESDGERLAKYLVETISEAPDGYISVRDKTGGVS